jgi:hypothetical protein
MDLGIQTFDQWVDRLSGVLGRGKQIGMNREQITSSAKILGNYLAEHVDPDAPENRVIKSLWAQGTDEERRALASMMVKLVDAHKR